MQLFIEYPSVELYPGIVVDKDTVLEYTNESVTQTVKDLVLHSVTTIKGEGYESANITTIELHEGDVLLFDEGGRGYIKPVAKFVSVSEAIRALEIIKPEE